MRAWGARIRWSSRRTASAPLAVLLAALLLVSLGCGGSGGGGGQPIDAGLAEAFGGLDFDRPVKLVQHPGDPDRWYVVEQGGEIFTFLASDPLNTVTSALDLSASVDLGTVTGSGEQGLLGLAFDPDFDAVNGGELYLSYTDDTAGKVVLARYESDDGGLTFTPLTVPLLAIDHPLDNHNGGDVQFDADGRFLYWSMGDGGGSGDPGENAQNPKNLLGTIMRLDVRAMAPPGLPYAIPPGNPFTSNPSCYAAPQSLPCPEIWAYGFRNPWRFGVDPITRELWVGDVGESTLEEIDFVVSGGNYGWDCLEGTANFEFVPPCDITPFVAPEVVHGRSEAQSIVGGPVYRGTDVPALSGYLIYGDFVTGNMWALDTRVATLPIQLSVPALAISAFGQGADGEVYVVTFDSPSIYKLVPP